MKRKILSACLILAIALIAMMNVNVVLDSKTKPIVKLESFVAASADEYDTAEFVDDPSNLSGYYDEHGYVPPGKKRKMKDIFNGTHPSTGVSAVTSGVSETVKGNGTWKISAGGKLAETTSATSSSSSSGSGEEATFTISFEWGSNYVVTYDRHDCDKSNTNPCQTWNTFKGRESY